MGGVMDGFDLGQAKPVVEREDEGQVVALVDQAGNPLTFDGGKPVTVTVVGTYSKRYRQARNAQVRAMRSRRGAFDPEEAERDAIELHAQCVTAWAGFFDDGRALECTRANVAKVLAVAPWIHEQVVVAMEDHAGFFGSTSSD